MAPRRIQFLVDDGARAEDIKELREQCPGIQIGLGCAAGVVHLKAYYLEFVKSNGQRQRRSRRFLFGSANATKAAFDGETNAELLAAVELSVNGDKQLITYLEKVLEAIERGSGKIEPAALSANKRVPTLFLPRFRIKKPGPPPGFDAWLQRGKLAAKYRDPQQFLKIPFKLEKPLPQAQTAELFASGGLVPQGSRDMVRYSYIGEPVARDEGKEESRSQWKAQYCVWTHLGDWMSDDCYSENLEAFTPRSKRDRELEIAELIENCGNDNWRENKIECFLQTLEALWKRLDGDNGTPSDY